jgi:ABC-type Fe3+-hydroxamate transport system substrate-binding protein
VSTGATCDALGTVHGRAGSDARIVSLVPSITELVCDLGLSDQLVGRTGFCIHPWDTVRTIPKVGGTKDVKLDRVRALEPTHAIVNIDENLRETARQLAEFVPHVIVTHPQSPADNLGLYRLLGEIFDRAAEAERLCAEFSAALSELQSVEHVPLDVLYLIWREPWMAVAPDTYIARTLALINWRSHPLEAGDRYPQVELSAYAGRVDRVLLSSEPFHFKERHIPEVQALVPGAQVTLIDGEMTSWYGSRAIAGLRYLGQLAAGSAAASPK